MSRLDRSGSCHHASVIARPPLAVPLSALAAFVVLLGLVVGGWTPLNRFDAAVSGAFRAYGVGRAGFVAGLRLATDVAATVPYLATGLALSVLFTVRRDRRRAAFCAVVAVAVPALWSLMHYLLHAPRPQAGFIVADGNGFPSGHTANAAAAALAAVLLLWPRAGWPVRTAALALAASFAVFIGATRVALLAHWPADVLGGWLLALVVVPLAARLVDRDVQS
jgi:undecaprenyl-diphosphatase